MDDVSLILALAGSISVAFGTASVVLRLMLFAMSYSHTHILREVLNHNPTASPPVAAG